MRVILDTYNQYNLSKPPKLSKDQVTGYWHSPGDLLLAWVNNFVWLCEADKDARSILIAEF